MEEEKVLRTNTFQHKIKRTFAGWDEKGRKDGGGPYPYFSLLCIHVNVPFRAHTLCFHLSALAELLLSA